MASQNIVDLIEQIRKQETDAEHVNKSAVYTAMEQCTVVWLISPLVSETLGNSPRLVQESTA